MIGVTLKKSYDVPCRWAELDRKAFIRIASAAAKFERGEMDYNTLRMHTVAAALGLRMRRLRSSEDLCENFFRLSEALDFYEVIDDGDSKVLDVRIVLSEQKIPKIGRYTGYIFTRRGGVVDTDMTAEKYIDALSLMSMYSETGSQDALDKLVAVLYSGNPYTSERARLVKTDKIPQDVKYAVYFNFRGILEWIQRIPKYDMIFHTTSSSRGKKPLLGPEASLYSLSKSGFGTVEEIGRMPLFSYLDIQLAVTMQGVRELKSLKVPIPEICDRMNLTVQQISTVL